MLPIDEHARDGRCHLVSGEGWKEPTLAWWYSSLNCWLAQNGSSLPIQPTHYVPMPWLMHAGAMRATLDGCRKVAEFHGWGAALDGRLIMMKSLEEISAATEWPKKEG